MRRDRHLPLHDGLLPRRGTSPVHILCGGVPAVYTGHWYEFRDGDVLGVQLYLKLDVAGACGGFHTAGSVWILCGVELPGLGLRLFPAAGDEGTFNCLLHEGVCADKEQNLTLEELDTVFSVGNKEHSKYYMEKLPWYINKHILRRDVEPMAPLYQVGEYAERGVSVHGPRKEVEGEKAVQ